MSAMGSAVGAATRVLIVDDEEYQRAGLASMVSSWGFGAETAADGQEALEQRSPDIRRTRRYAGGARARGSQKAIVPDLGKLKW